MNPKIEEIEVNGDPRWGITLEEYPNTVFVLDSVEFKEENERVRMRYHYEVVEGYVPEGVEKFDFEQKVGDFIVWHIENRPEDQPVVYARGT